MSQQLLDEEKQNLIHHNQYVYNENDIEYWHRYSVK